MSKKLVIVESPAKAKTISQYLGGEFLVKASFGHVRDLPTKTLGIDVDHDFAVTYESLPKAKAVLTSLKNDLKTADAIYLATDLDREGEAIAWHLVEALKPKQPIHRITFHEITKSAITNAFANPRELSQNLIDSQQARRILDRLVGYKLSPLLWKKVYRGLSAGRVQSVAVRLVVEREREIQAFKTREFWTLELGLTGKHGQFSAYLASENSTARQELNSQAELEKVSKQLKGKTLKVTSIEQTNSQLNPQPPLITSTLQQMGAQLLGFSAKKTMKIAQDLYEGVEIDNSGTTALITYMRTDSFQLSDDARAQAKSLITKDFGDKYLPSTPNAYTKKVKGAQEAHEAIRPTSFTHLPDSLKTKLSRDHFRLYELVWRTAIASQMSPAQVETTTASLLSANKDRFIARGRKLKFDGFLKVIPGSEERFEDLSELEENEEATIKTIIPTQHFTEPPARYSEATLVKELEKRGIGRPSTYAPIMSTIIDRGYVTKKTGRFQPEAVAEVVTDLLTENFTEIIDYNFTAQMEDQLDDISDGKEKILPVLKAFWTPFAKLLKEKEKTIDKKELTEEKTDKKCPESGHPLVIKLGRYGKFYACSGFPDCKYTAPMLDETLDKDEKKDIEDQAKEKCPECGGDLTIKQGRFGTFLGCSNYPKCKFTKPIIISIGVKCPNCGQEIVRKNSKRGRVFWGCSGYPKCKTAFWNEPTNKKCPKCQNLLVKKKKGELACSQCDYTEPYDSETDKAE